MTNTDLFRNSVEPLRPGLKKLQGAALIALVIGVVLSAVGFFVEGQDSFFRSWLTSYLYWFGMTVGCIGLLMLHHTVGGGWGFIIRRMLEAGSRCLPLIFVLFIPILLGMHSLFEWTHESAAHDPIIQEKVAYLNLPFFIGRFICYFLVWGVFAFLMNKWAAVYDERSDARAFGNLNRLGAFGLLIHVLLVTFMATDWVMSLTPHWFSSMLGPLFVAGQALATIALMNVFVGTLGTRSPLLQLVPQRYFRDLGNFMMALTLVWSYLSFSQYLIQYSGNIAEEVGWYVVRRHGGWGIVGLMLVFLHFALPFAVLLSSAMKTNPRNLWKIAAFMLFMRWVDLLYLSRPSLEGNLLEALNIADVGTFCIIGGAWLWLWASQVQKRPLVPAHDPRFAYNWAVHEHHREHGEPDEEIAYAVPVPDVASDGHAESRSTATPAIGKAQPEVTG